MQDKELKNRVRAFTGAFIVMISPVLLAIVLKKVNLTAAGKYQGIRMLEVLVGLVQRSFAHLAAATLIMGILPFLCVMVSEACDILPSICYVAQRLKVLTKVLLFVANVLLMLLGSGILLLFHKNALVVVIFCSTLVIVSIIITIVTWSQDDTAEENHSELEHLLEFSSGVTVMMFLVLECVVLEGLLRNGQGQPLFLGSAQPPGSTPSAARGQETFLGGTLLISFVTTAFGVSLMNVWTVLPRLWTLTAALPWCLNFILHAVPVAAVLVLITLEVLPDHHKFRVALVWLPFLPPFLVLMTLLARYSCEVDTTEKEDQGQAGRGAQAKIQKAPQVEQVEIQMAPHVEQVQERVSSGGIASSSSDRGQAQQPEDKDKEPDEDEKQLTDKPAPLELTKVAFTGFLAVAVPSVATNASVGNPSIVFVLSTAATVLMGLLWRLLTTHEDKAKPPSCVLNAANHASFGAHLLILIAGFAFWVMAVNV